jgi:hypothetical protein
MADDSKISALTAVSAVAGTNEFVINEAGTSKKVSMTQLSAFMRTLQVGHRTVARLTADHSNATTTGTEVTDLSITLTAGTYLFNYFLICQTSLAATGIGLGINYTGTATRLSFTRRSVSGGTGTIDGNMQSAINTLAGNMTHGYAATAETTTAPNTLNTGAQNVNIDCMVYIEGIIVVSDGGDLELWHSSEDANATRVEQESCVVVVRLA